MRISYFVSVYTVYITPFIYEFNFVTRQFNWFSALSFLSLAHYLDHLLVLFFSECVIYLNWTCSTILNIHFANNVRKYILLFMYYVITRIYLRKPILEKFERVYKGRAALETRAFGLVFFQFNSFGNMYIVRIFIAFFMLLKNL